MNRAKAIFVFSIFILAFLIVFASQSAMAGCQVRPGFDPLDPDPQASGTKYVGPITVFYNKNQIGDENDDQICWFVRLRKGQSLYSFAECSDKTFDGDLLDPRLFPGDAANLIKYYFFPKVAIPAIYGCILSKRGIALQLF